MTVTPAQLAFLRWMVENGGEFYVDDKSRLVACGTANHRWLGHNGVALPVVNLVAKGFVSGGDHRLRVTDAGRAVIAPEQKIQIGPLDV